MKSRNERLLKLVKEWTTSIGKKEAMNRLILHGLGLSTIDKIIHGRYESTPGNVLSAILENEMMKDNFLLDETA